jgi:hypothetical protein
MKTAGSSLWIGILRRLWLNSALVAVLMLSLSGAEPVSVELTEVSAIGKSVAGDPNARELALADALREAVRAGAGVDLISQTQVTDLQLDFDRIFTSAFGYVRDYQVLDTALTNDGFFQVRIRARVAKGAPELNDRLAMRQLIRRKQSPKLALYVEEEISKLPAPSEFARNWFEQEMRALELNLVDVKDLGEKSERLARRDGLFGEERKFNERTAALEFDGDFIVHVKLDGKYLGEKTIYGTVPQHRFSLRCDLRILRPDSQKVIVSIPMRAMEDLETDSRDITAAARDCVQQLLEGRPSAGQPGAYPLFKKMFAAWITELDLGALITVEVHRATKVRYDRVVAALSGVAGVTAVFPGTFDRRGFSFLEIESRLDSRVLSHHIETALGADYALDRLTRHYVQFVFEPEDPDWNRRAPGERSTPAPRP